MFRLYHRIKQSAVGKIFFSFFPKRVLFQMFEKSYHKVGGYIALPITERLSLSALIGSTGCVLGQPAHTSGIATSLTSRIKC